MDKKKIKKFVATETPLVSGVHKTESHMISLDFLHSPSTPLELKNSQKYRPQHPFLLF